MTDEQKESVAEFCNQMVKKLEKNDHKGDWVNLSISYLYERLLEEVEELSDSVRGSGGFGSSGA